MANITKRDVLNALNTVDFAEEISVGDVVVTPNDIKEYIEKSLTQIDARNEKAAERQAKKRAEVIKNNRPKSEKQRPVRPHRGSRRWEACMSPSEPSSQSFRTHSHTWPHCPAKPAEDAWHARVT